MRSLWKHVPPGISLDGNDRGDSKSDTDSDALSDAEEEEQMTMGRYWEMMEVLAKFQCRETPIAV